MRKTLTLFLFILAGASFAQSDFWPFGRGYSLEFNVSPPRLGNVPWQPTDVNNNKQLSQSTVYAEEDKLKLYFLNGIYYDSLQNEIFRVPNYKRDEHNDFIRMTGKSQTLFLKNQDTIYHIYTSGSLYVNLNTVPLKRFDFRRFYLSRIIEDSSGYQVAVVDSFPRVDDTISGSYGRNFKVVPQDSLPLGMVFEYRSPSVYSPDGYYNNTAIYVNNGRFESVPMIIDTRFRSSIYQGSIYNPLTETFIIPEVDRWQCSSLQNDSIIRQYRMIFGNNGLRFAKVDSFYISPLAALGRPSRRLHMHSLGLGPQGRYLFMQVYEDEDCLWYNGREYRLFRIDLFGSDTLGYRDSVVQVPSSAGHFIDMQSGPDGHLYYMWNQQPAYSFSSSPPWTGSHPENRTIGRIINPTAADTSLIISRPEFARTGRWGAYSMFPDLSTDQLFKDGFEVLYACADSVKFKLNFGRELDSAVWNFGDPRLGPANRSTQLDPTVVYPSPGKYLVHLNLWWNGQRLHGLADSVEVYPLVDFDMPRDTLLCEGDSLWLNYDQGFSARYRWSTGDTTAAISIRRPGWYSLEVSNRCGSIRDSVLVHEIPPYYPSLQDQSYCLEDSAISINLPDEPGLFYRWSTGDTTANVRLTDTGNYQVLWGSLCDTLAESFRLSKVSCACELFIPNAFTPNGDGRNDRFQIESSCQELEYELRIFNRWGQLMYQQDQDESPWDGTFRGRRVQGGVYVYKVSYRGKSEGKSLEGKKSGSITVMP